MSIPDELKKLLKQGDLTLIQEMYAERHSMGQDPDYDTVTIEYIRLLISGERNGDSDKAQEILAIASKLLEHKRNFIQSVIVTILLVIGFFFCTSCEVEEIENVEYRVDAELVPYVDKFFEEASLRGVHLDKYNLRVMIRPDDELIGASGRSETMGRQRVVSIRQDAFDIWTSRCPEALENLVFHELGHALLYRDHCKQYSIMQAEISQKEYAGKPELRKTLLDELFSSH
jgi:hypothetical protein